MASTEIDEKTTEDQDDSDSEDDTIDSSGKDEEESTKDEEESTKDEEESTKDGEESEETLEESESWTSETTSVTDLDATDITGSQETETTPTSEIPPENAPKKTTLEVGFRQAILNIKGRQIKAEDFEWATPPVPNLAEIVLETDHYITESNLEKFLRVATTSQKSKISANLRVIFPLEITLPLIDDENYWKRMCESKSYPAWNLWRFSDSWKSMFVQEAVQELIEGYHPNETDLPEFLKSLNAFSDFALTLKIRKLAQVSDKLVSIDLLDEDFDDKLDDIIAHPLQAVYIDFEKLFGCLLNIKDLTFMLNPNCLDYENLHLSIPDFNAFFRGFKRLSLQKLKISNGATTNEHLAILLRHLLTSTTLSELDLSYNFIDDEVSDYVGKLLLSNCPLEALCLKNNSITDLGACSIAAGLSENNRIKKLDVSLNLIGDEGACFLAEVLISNSSMVDLDVSKIKAGHEFGIVLSKLIQTSNNLRSLKIQENHLGEKAGNLIESAMIENSILLELDIHFCGFSYNNEASIYQSILRNRKKTSYYSYVRAENVTASEFLY